MGGRPLKGERVMDPLGSLKSEVLQPALVLIIPGLIAGAPYLFVLDHYFPWVAPFADDHPTLSTFLSLVASAVFGMLVYEFGTNIEAKWIDRKLQASGGYEKLEDEWYRYLRLTFNEYSVGQQYIAERVMYYKFELGVVAAMPVCLLGTGWAYFLRDSFPAGLFLGILLFLIVGAVYFLCEAYATGKGLARVRQELLKGVGNPPR